MSSKNVHIYRIIRAKLLAGFYDFGTPISVKEISEETGISRQPIMTALYRLQEHGFVDITAQVGCRVVQPSLQEVVDFYQMFAAIEGVIASMAAMRATPEGVTKLIDINQRIAILDPSAEHVDEQYRLLNIEFHTQLHALAQSPRVCARQQAYFDLSDFYLIQTNSFKQNLSFVNEEHQQIIDALIQKNSALATRLSHDHILSVANYLRENWNS